MQLRRMALAMLSGISMSAFAAGESMSLGNTDSKTTIDVKDVAPPPKDITPDHRITDLELRAQAGSVNRYSLKFNFGYSGPPIDNLSDPNKPNPDNRPGD